MSCERINILFISHRIPYPPDKGDKIRSFHVLKYLAEHHNIFLITILDSPEDEQHLSDLEPFCKQIFGYYYNKRVNAVVNIFKRRPFTVGHFYDRRVQVRVDKILENEPINAVYCISSSTAEYVFRSKAFRSGQLSSVQLIMDFIDLDSDKWLQYAKHTNGTKRLIYRLENWMLSEYEKKIYHEFDRSIFVSDREVDDFKRAVPDIEKASVIPNGVDSTFFHPCSRSNKLNGMANESTEDDFPSERKPEFDDSFSTGLFERLKKNKHPKLLFTGIMDYFANEDGVVWFCHETFPLIRKEIPDCLFYIVGNRPNGKVWALSEIDGVIVTGYVPDIRIYYWAADVCVVPLRIARGIQNKVLEAMATGTAIVATSNASDGILCNKGSDILIEDCAGSFAEEVVAIIRNHDYREKLGNAARLNILQNYSWKKHLSSIDFLLNKMQ